MSPPAIMNLDDPDEVTSDFDASTTASTSEFTSIATGRLLYSYEHGSPSGLSGLAPAGTSTDTGRRYQAFLQGRYGMPNDDLEQSREAIKHKLYVDYILEGKLLLAPIGDYPQKIVDLGTGVGFWAQDVAEHFPSARVIGTDISPIQPHWTAPNVEFRVEDLEDEHRPWTKIYGDADLIHVRALLQTLRDPCRLLQRCFENLKPGGWIETHEIIPFVVSDDGTVEDDHPMNTLYLLVIENYKEVYGWNLHLPRQIPKILREKGFVNVQEAHSLIPIGRWHPDAKQREIGLFALSVLEDFVVAILTRYDILKLSAEEANDLGQEILDALQNPRIHARLDFIDCWGQKPL
ncbi:putative methyltransferase tdiE [Paramyrothecium foliicola]|nr:putative methyltransferase tdiE [Paramyrothecium foliicola]